MAARNIAPKIVLSGDEKDQLSSFASSRSLPHSQVTRAKIILLAAEGRTNIEIASMLSTTRETVGRWRKRYIEKGIEGLYDELRPGKPRSISDAEIANLIKKTLETTPDGSTHWSVRTMATETGLSKSTIHRVWNTFGLQPHRQKHFKLSTDPFFIEKIRDVVGLYLNPPEHAGSSLCRREKPMPGSGKNHSRCFH